MTRLSRSAPLRHLPLFLLLTACVDQPTQPKVARVQPHSPANQPGPRISNQPADVLVIVTDDQRWDSYTSAVMPLTRALLDPESVEFTLGFVTTSLCCPSRSSIFTGRYSHNTGVLTNSLPFGCATR